MCLSVFFLLPMRNRGGFLLALQYHAEYPIPYSFISCLGLPPRFTVHFSRLWMSDKLDLFVEYQVCVKNSLRTRGSLITSIFQPFTARASPQAGSAAASPGVAGQGAVCDCRRPKRWECDLYSFLPLDINSTMVND